MTGQVFMLPDLGEGLTDAVVLEWKVEPGDAVAIDQIVVEVETAKASVEVPCPFEGVVAELHGAEGDVLAVGTPLITVTGSVTTEVSTAREQYRDKAREQSLRSDHQDDVASGNVASGNVGSGNVLIGYGTGHGPTGRRRRVQSASRPTGAPMRSSSPKVLSPIVRRLALDEGLELGAIFVEGDHGVITRADVERALDAPLVSPTSGVTRVPITGIRRVIADKMSRSRAEIPEATVWVDVDATALLQARRDLDASIDGVKVTLLAVLAKLTLIALSKYPELNSTVDTAAQEIHRYEDIHLGIAAQTDRGLMVPVLAQANRADLRELSQRLAETTEMARTGSIPPARLSGGTFTLNNYGVFGVDGSAAIINHPEAAILGIGRIIDRPWVVDGVVTARKIAQLSLAFDHRVCDGGVAGGFLRTIADYIENPVVALAAVR